MEPSSFSIDWVRDVVAVVMVVAVVLPGAAGVGWVGVEANISTIGIMDYANWNKCG